VPQARDGDRCAVRFGQLTEERSRARIEADIGDEESAIYIFDIVGEIPGVPSIDTRRIAERPQRTQVAVEHVNPVVEAVGGIKHIFPATVLADVDAEEPRRRITYHGNRMCRIDGRIPATDDAGDAVEDEQRRGRFAVCGDREVRGGIVDSPGRQSAWDAY